jgi:hypothetical protein
MKISRVINTSCAVYDYGYGNYSNFFNFGSYLYNSNKNLYLDNKNINYSNAFNITKFISLPIEEIEVFSVVKK